MSNQPLFIVAMTFFGLCFFILLCLTSRCTCRNASSPSHRIAVFPEVFVFIERCGGVCMHDSGFWPKHAPCVSLQYEGTHWSLCVSAVSDKVLVFVQRLLHSIPVHDRLHLTWDGAHPLPNRLCRSPHQLVLYVCHQSSGHIESITQWLALRRLERLVLIVESGHMLIAPSQPFPVSSLVFDGRCTLCLERILTPRTRQLHLGPLVRLAQPLPRCPLLFSPTLIHRKSVEAALKQVLPFAPFEEMSRNAALVTAATESNCWLKASHRFLPLVLSLLEA